MNEGGIYMSISKIRENARVALSGKWGKGVCIVLAYLAIVFAAAAVIESFEDSLISDITPPTYLE